MAAAEEYFVAEGCGRLTMNMVLTAPGRSRRLPEFKIARKEEVLGDFMLPSLEIAGPGCTGSRSRARSRRGRGVSSDTTQAMLDAYPEYFEIAPGAMRPGSHCHDVHVAVAKGFHDRGFHLGHVTGHSIGMTMIEFPKIGEGVETELAREHGASRCIRTRSRPNGEDCFYMQDTWLVTADGGVPLAALPMEIAVDDRLADGLVADEDGVVRCWWGGGDDRATARTTTTSGACPVTDDRAAVREALPRGLPVGPLLAHDPAQARGLPAGVRGLRLPRASRASARATSSGCSETRRSCATAARSSRRSTTPVARSSSSRPKARSPRTSGDSSRSRRAPERMTREALRELAQTDASRALAKDLKRRVGRSSGRRPSTRPCRRWALVNDHLDGCAARGASRLRDVP